MEQCLVGVTTYYIELTEVSLCMKKKTTAFESKDQQQEECRRRLDLRHHPVTQIRAVLESLQNSASVRSAQTYNINSLSSSKQKLLWLSPVIYHNPI